MDEDSAKKPENIHRGHRSRLKKLFLEQGIDSFNDHNVLELLLFYALGVRDVNPLAHQLLRRFKTLSGVFDASVQDLMKVEGMGEHTAILIKLVPQVAKRYLVSRGSVNNILDSSQRVGAYLVPYFFGAQEELVYLLGLDAKCKALGVRLVGHGTVDSANVSTRKVVEMAISMNAVQVVLGHNHPSGNAMPSMEDKLVTRKIYNALKTVDIMLVDHLVVADDDFVSMRDSGMMSYLNG